MSPHHRTLLACALAAVVAGPVAAQDEGTAATHAAVTLRSDWAALDVNGDARLSAEEASVDAALSGIFAVVDTDGDGYVDAGEFRAHVQAGHVVEASDTGAARAAAHSAVAVRTTWAALDVDGDGRVSAAEADADPGFDGGFAGMDADGDGFVTQAEFRAGARARRDPPR